MGIYLTLEGSTLPAPTYAFPNICPTMVRHWLCDRTMAFSTCLYTYVFGLTLSALRRCNQLILWETWSRTPSYSAYHHNVKLLRPDFLNLGELNSVPDQIRGLLKPFMHLLCISR